MLEQVIISIQIIIIDIVMAADNAIVIGMVASGFAKENRKKIIAILNKPSGLLTHKKNGLDNSPNLQESLKDQFTIDDNDYLKEGIVHRLDKDTTGLIVVAKTDEAHHNLVHQFASRLIRRTYTALIWGSPFKNSFQINAPIGRSSKEKRTGARCTTR